MKFSKWYIVIGLLMISVFVNYKYYKVNDRYELYLSGEMANQISPLATSIFENADILEKVLQDEVITRELTEVIESNFRQIGMQSQDILYQASRFDRIGHEVKNIAALKNSDIRYYFEKIKRDLDEGEKISLTHEQVEQIKVYKTLVDEYKKIIDNELIAVPVKDSVSDNIAHIHYGMPEGYWDAYREEGITHDYWVNIILKMANPSIYK